MRLQKNTTPEGFAWNATGKKCDHKTTLVMYLLIQAKMRPEKNATPQGVAFLAFISY